MRSNCPVSCWLDVFGDRWTLLIIRDITIFGKTHYKDFMCSAEGISTNVLADRLKKLVDQGILTKERDESNKLLWNYGLTEKGATLKPIFEQIVNWQMRDYPGWTAESFPEYLKQPITPTPTN